MRENFKIRRSFSIILFGTLYLGRVMCFVSLCKLNQLLTKSVQSGATPCTDGAGEGCMYVCMYACMCVPHGHALMDMDMPSWTWTCPHGHAPMHFNRNYRYFVVIT